MSGHTDFHRRANARIAERRQRAAQTCEECGGRWWPQARRIWHRFDCPRNPVLRKHHSEAEQDRQRADALADYDPGCEHGYADWLECPGCTEAADRMHKERYRMTAAEEYDRVLESQWETRRQEVGP